MRIMIGESVIVRSHDEFPFLGTLVSVEGQMVDLKNAQRVSTKDGITLNEVAIYGIVNCKLYGSFERICLYHACEIIPITKEAKKTFYKTR